MLRGVELYVLLQPLWGKVWIKIPIMYLEVGDLTRLSWERPAARVGNIRLDALTTCTQHREASNAWCSKSSLFAKGKLRSTHLLKSFSEAEQHLS